MHSFNYAPYEKRNVQVKYALKKEKDNDTV
jgi:hypothetical protein